MDQDPECSGRTAPTSSTETTRPSASRLLRRILPTRRTCQWQERAAATSSIHGEAAREDPAAEATVAASKAESAAPTAEIAAPAAEIAAAAKQNTTSS